jgi:hypothetical protein
MLNETHKTAAWLDHMTSTPLAQFEEIPFHGSVIRNLYAKPRRCLHVIKCTFHTYRRFTFLEIVSDKPILPQEMYLLLSISNCGTDYKDTGPHL